VKINGEAYGLDEFGHTSAYRTGDETYYRYGYRIGNATPRFLGNVPDRAKAASAAKSAADEAHAALEKLGAPTDVCWWIQRETKDVAYTYDEPEMHPSAAAR
jgi:hypothetical protein